MDKQLLQAFNNLSVALQMLTEAMERNASSEKEGSSSIVDAVKKLDVTEQLKLLSDGIEQIQKDNVQITKDHKSILDKLARISDRQSQDTKKIQSTNEAIKKQKDQTGPDYVPDKKESRTITDGVKVVLLIAAGILAIGLAFKVLGAVNFKTVVAIGLVLPLIAIAYKKIAEIKVEIKDLIETTKGLVIFSLAVVVSSWILSMTKIVSPMQAVTMVLIAATFAIVAPNIAKMAQSIKGLDIRGLLMMPLVLVVAALAIAASSYLLALTMPISIPQALTVVLISVAFAVMANSIAKMTGQFKMVSLIGLFLMPIVLVLASWAIMKSSYLLAAVQPVGLPQILTTIGISAAFALLGYGIGKLTRDLGKVSPIGVIMLPIVLVATSYAIMVSSQFLSKVELITFAQFLTAIGIGLVFTVLSLALPMLSKAVQKIDIAKAALMPLVFVSLSLAVMLSSYVLSEAKVISASKLVNLVFQAVALTVIAIAMGFSVWVLDKMGLADADGVETVGWAAISILIISTAIMASSLILSQGTYTGAPGLEWTLQAGVSILAFGVMIYLIDKARIGIDEAIIGGLVILAIAGTIYLVSEIFSKASWEGAPEISWTLQTGAAILAYGLLAGAVGTAIVATSGVGAIALVAGLAAVLLIAMAIVEVDSTLSEGSYSGGPSMEWVLTTTLLLGGFGAVMAGAGIAIVGIGLGYLSIKIIAKAILEVDEKLSEGSYSKYPSLAYSASTVLLITAYGALMATTGALLPLMWLGKKSLITISEAIVESAAILSGGNYSGGPTPEWARGVNLALQAFAPVFKAISSQGLVGLLFGGGASAEQMSSAIRMISQSIVDAANFFADAKVAFTGGPTKAWSEGVGGAIAAFAPVIKEIKDKGILGSLFGGATSPEKMAHAIRTISQAIVEAAIFFKAANVAFEGGPKKEWSEGVGSAINAFAPVFENLQSSGLMGFFTGSSPKDMYVAIRVITQGLIDSGRMFQENADVTYGVYPKAEWSEGVSKAIVAFSPAMKWAAENNGWFTSDSDDLKATIMAMADSIVAVSRKLQDGVFTAALDPKYFDSLGEVYKKMFALYEKVQGYDIDEDGMRTMERVALGIAVVSVIVGKGNYNISVPETWGDDVRRLYTTYAGLDGIVGSMGSLFAGIVGEGGPSTDKVQAVASSIAQLSTTISTGNYGLTVGDEYTNSLVKLYVTYRMIDEMVQGGFTDMLGGLVGETKTVLGVGNEIVELSRILATGNYAPIPVEYMGNVYQNISNYLKIVDMLAYRSWNTEVFGDTLRSGVDIVKIASDYDKLTDSITRLSQAVMNIDLEKMAALRSLTGTVVLMSLMDATQFNELMDAFEERASVLVDTINSLDSDVAEAEAKSAGSTGPAVKKPSAGTATATPSMTEALDLLRRIEGRLAMIANSTNNVSAYVSQLRAAGNQTSLKSK